MNIRTAWLGMRNRCTNPTAREYKYYGGRGITLCREWLESFPAFSAYVRDELGDRPSPSHSIDRIDNNSGYRPGNIRWADKIQQARNRRPYPVSPRAVAAAWLRAEGLTFRQVGLLVGASRTSAYAMCRSFRRHKEFSNAAQ